MTRETEALARAVVQLATARNLRVAVAESLTGGMLASAIVSVPGASQVLNGGIVAYDTGLKATLLGVDPALLRARGPVDGEVAQQMAAGVRRACDAQREGGSAQVPADLGIATTGVAGPDADPQTGQPPGTVWLGLSSRLGERAQLLSVEGQSRSEIREAAVAGALHLLVEALEAPSAVPCDGNSAKS